MTQLKRGIEDISEIRDSFAIVTDRPPSTLWETKALGEALYRLVSFLARTLMFRPALIISNPLVQL